MIPAWAGTADSAFLAGFGIAELGFAALFGVLIGWVILRRLLVAAGLMDGSS